MPTAMPCNPHRHPTRRVRIGEASPVELIRRLAAAQVRTNAAADQLLADARFKTLRCADHIECVEISVKDTGLPGGGTIAQVIEAAAARGLAVCPLELAPHLRLALMDQAEGAVGFAPTQHRAPPGSLTVVSAPLSDDEDTPKGFYLRRIEGELWLRGYTSWPGHVWAPEDRLIFAIARLEA